MPAGWIILFIPTTLGLSTLARPQAHTAQEEEEGKRNGSTLCQIVIRTRLSSPNEIICPILSVPISLPHPTAAYVLLYYTG